MKGFELFKQSITWIIEFFVAAGIIAAIMILSGCCILETHEEPTPQNNIIPEVINPKDFVFTGLVCGFVLGIVGIGMGFGKLGISISGACIAGVFLRTTLITYMSNFWFSIAVALVVLAGCCLMVGAILWKNKAIKELIIGGSQSKTTKATVAKVKHKLMMKGKL